jgi:aspartyl-tRNA synthetase
MVNEEMATGAIEVGVAKITILSTSEPVPFTIDERAEGRDDVRLRYRYLDLRTFSMQRKIALRHQVMQEVRQYLSSRGFLEIETPTLIRSTPEGARDFLVPSRLHPGSFYAMPQSPQLYKQILMISGFDRYFQIAHCFRDEDARGDRQLEHTQIDIEMSFVSREDVFTTIEGMMQQVFSATKGIDLPTPFPRLSYYDAMNRYGSDKPDLRFSLELQDFANFVPDSGFSVFEGALAAGGAVKVLVVPGGATLSRKNITELEEVARTYGAKGLAWTRVSGEESVILEGGIGKFFTTRGPEICKTIGAQSGDMLLFVADTWRVATTALGAVRTRLARDLNLIEPGLFRFASVVDFPLFEQDEDTGGWTAAHHMFTMPQERFIETLESDLGAVLGDLYDLVCNGFELASGSIRIHDPALQARIFNIVGFDAAEGERRFGFLLEALRYGAPPHGGIAPGLDRLVMIMAEEESIREVIAFPKTANGLSPMDGSPNAVDPEQLRELQLTLALNTANRKME